MDERGSWSHQVSDHLLVVLLHVLFYSALIFVGQKGPKIPRTELSGEEAMEKECAVEAWLRSLAIGKSVRTRSMIFSAGPSNFGGRAVLQ